MSTTLDYIDHDGERRTLSGCHMTQDKVGRYWLWSDQMDRNLAYKARDRDACLLAAIDNLLFTISLRDERIAALNRIETLAQQFADQIKPDEEHDQ